MLRISKMADYATVIMNWLATHPEGVFSAAEIARQVHISMPTASKLLKLLLEAKLVVSTRGAGGGYKLVRSAQEISVIEVVGAIDGMPALTECSQGDKICQHDAVCALRDNWRIINQVIVTALSGVTMADLMKPLKTLAWVTPAPAPIALTQTEPVEVSLEQTGDLVLEQSNG